MSRNDEYGMVEWLREHRVELGPVYLGVPVLAGGLTAHIVLTLVQTIIAVIVLAAAGFTIAGSRKGQGLRKIYFSIITVFVCGWILAAHQIPNARGAWIWLLFTLVVGGTLVAIPWWADNVKRTHVRMEHIIKSWPIRAARIRLTDTALVGFHTTPIGWTAKLSWMPGQYQVEDVEKRLGEIEGALALQHGQLRMPRDGKSTNSINLVVVKQDPHETSLPWEIPTTTVNGQLVLKRLKAEHGIDLGVREDGVRKKLVLWVKGWGARQLLAAGIKGSGKSMALNIIWATFALCTDVVQWGVDLKGGMELGLWRPLFDWVVTTREDAVEMMAAIEEIIDERASHSAGKWKVWPASREWPLLVVSVDEAASLLGASAKAKDIDRVAELARKGRAVGVIIILATQYPTLEALGSSQIRQQIDQRLCFRMADENGEAYVMPGHVVRADKIDAERPGTCFHLDGAKLDKMPMRTYYLADETINQLVSLLEGETTTLDAVSQRVADECEAYANREMFVSADRDGERESGRDDRDDDRDGERDSDRESSETEDDMAENIPPWESGEGVSIEDMVSRRREGMTDEERDAADRAAAEEVAEPERLDEDAANAKLEELLRAAGEEGIRAGKLAQACTRGSSWLYDKLDVLGEAGKVKRTKHGSWTWDQELSHSA
jgi:S-DNA-T family DNA segregation ATPase FtsK/SpoIIIE